MKAGRLVPDEMIIGLIDSRLDREDCPAASFLDGFPRTLPQATALDAMLGEKAPRARQGDLDRGRRRSDGRAHFRPFTCARCGEGYHDKFKRPKVDGVLRRVRID